MSNRPIPVIGFAAYSGTGKTTLLVRLIPFLKARGLRVGVIKHSHHDFEIDQAGKDSYRLRSVGATATMLVSPYRRVIISEFSGNSEITLQEQIQAFPDSEVDLILVEGFRHEAFPKIELHRPSLSKPLIYPDDGDVIAIASDQPLTTPAHIPCLDLNDINSIGQFILQIFQKQTGQTFAQTNYSAQTRHIIA